MDNLEHFLPAQNTLGEGPIWSVAEQALYWVDVENKNYHRFELASKQYETVDMGTRIGIMAQRASGGLLMATERGFISWNSDTKTLETIAHPESGKLNLRFNDGAVDCRGRFWAGTMNEVTSQAEGTLYRLDPDGSTHTMATDVTTPNGIGWSPDNTCMYFTDTGDQAIYAYDFDPERGEIANRRVFVSYADVPYLPDGLAVDSEGFIWSACWNGAKIVRYDPAGKLERAIDVPVWRPTSCVFGGPNLDELYITSARLGLTHEQLQLYPYSGDLFRLQTGIKGLEKFQFAG